MMTKINPLFCMATFLGLILFCLATSMKDNEINIVPGQGPSIEDAVVYTTPINATHRLVNHGREEICFTFSYPVWIKFPDGSERSVRSDETMFGILEKWSKEYNTPNQYPELRKPFLLLLDQFSYTFVQSEEDFHALLNDCYGKE